MAKRKGAGTRGPRLPRATLAYVRPGGDRAEVKASFMYCAIRAMVHEIATQARPLGLIDQQCASGQLTEARNEAVEYFLDTDVPWLWMVDSDMTFTDTCIDELLASAHPTERPVVGALCFGQRLERTDEHMMTNVFRCYPTIYVWKEKADDDGNVTDVGFQAQLTYPRDALVKCDATGAACFVVHRSVLEKIRDTSGPIWFDRLTHPMGKTFGEDLSFFARCAQVGAPVHVNTAVKTGHDKGGVVLTEEWYDDHDGRVE